MFHKQKHFPKENSCFLLWFLLTITLCLFLQVWATELPPVLFSCSDSAVMWETAPVTQIMVSPGRVY